jgi:cell division protein FtsZ
MEFNMSNKQTNIIKVIGVGGGGSNAVNYMYELGIQDVDFIVCNTDRQALDTSTIPLKVQLGGTLTGGRGAGSIPDVGRNAAIENIDEIKAFLEDNTNMVFITAGMGGGTGTGAAPVIAKIAKDMGILTVGIVTVPFSFEGKRRKEQADLGIKEMRNSVDTLLIINNDKLRDMYGNLTLRNAFSQADQVLASAAKGIAEVISKIGFINVDFNDVSTVMKDSGVAIMGAATAEGENRAIVAAEAALSSPLLNDNDIFGAKQILLNITFGDAELTMDEMSEITDFIQDAAGGEADVIMGQGYEETLGNKISVTIIATGFNSNPDTGVTVEEAPKTVHKLEEEITTMITKPVNSPTAFNSPTNNNRVEENSDKEEIEPYLKPEETVSEELSFEETNLERQAAFNFENLTSSSFVKSQEEIEVKKEESSKIIKYNLEDELEEDENGVVASVSIEESTTEVSIEEQQRMAEQRYDRIKELSVKLRTPFGLSDLENEPAYKRRNINLEDVPHSSDSQVSRYTLSEEDNDGVKSTGIKGNNSFLHDNVD